MTREEVIKLVQESELIAAAKNNWMSRINEEGMTMELLNDLQATFQLENEKILEKYGVTETPEYKELQAAMATKVKAAEEEYNSTMAQVNAKTQQLNAATGQALDALKVQVIQDKIAE
jgi:ElaB/YqjD/DUF883 family membrane-anchored ribosome-binding protein